MIPGCSQAELTMARRIARQELPADISRLALLNHAKMR